MFTSSNYQMVLETLIVSSKALAFTVKQHWLLVQMHALRTKRGDREFLGTTWYWCFSLVLYLKYNFPISYPLFRAANDHVFLLRLDWLPPLDYWSRSCFVVEVRAFRVYWHLGIVLNILLRSGFSCYLLLLLVTGYLMACVLMFLDERSSWDLGLLRLMGTLIHPSIIIYTT